MSALSYELLATALIERRCPFSIYELLAPILMQRSVVFPLMNYLLPSWPWIETVVHGVDAGEVSAAATHRGGRGLKQECLGLLEHIPCRQRPPTAVAVD